MRSRPDAADLLAIAREVLEGELMSGRSRNQRYDALMVANAVANAEREIAAGDAPLRAELSRLARHYGEIVTLENSKSLTAALERLNRRLIEDIRTGQLDGDKGIAAHLMETAIDGVRETNPKYLARRGIT